MARLITLQTFPDRSDGLFFCAFLQAHGFFAVAADEAIVGQNWLQALAIGGVRVQVMDCELAEIRAVLVEAGLEEPSRGESSAPKTADVHLPFRRQPALLGHPTSLATLGCVGFALVVWFFLEAIELDAGLNTDPRTLWLPVTVAFFLVMDVFPMALPLLRNRHPGLAAAATATDVRADQASSLGPVVDWRAGDLVTLKRFEDPQDAAVLSDFLQRQGFSAWRADEIGASPLDFRVQVLASEVDRIRSEVEAADLRYPSDKSSTASPDLEDTPGERGLPGFLSRNLEALVVLAVLALIVGGPIWRLVRA
ncbi:MAG: hypothetical protein ACTS10_11725 [Kiloniellales bacterium]